MQNLTDEEWEKEREIVRQQYVKEQDPHKFDQKEQLLQSFDREYQRRHPYEGEDKIIHREHGWSLWKDDD